MAEVRLASVNKSYENVHVLHNINLDIKDGEFVVFVGPSGCGKSTLLRTIAGLEDITSGDLYIGESRMNDIPPADRGIAMVFQSYALYPHMNLYDNMAFGLQLAKVPKDEIDRAVMHAAKILHIESLLDRKPKALSGGQRQRVAIGRAIVRKPQVFLFDEPLSNLDAALRVKMRLEFTKLHEELGATMIYVTHDQVEAMTLADQIVCLSAGKIEQVGSPLTLYHYPQNIFVAGFIGSPKMNFIDGTLGSIDSDSCVVETASGRVRANVDANGAKLGDKVVLGIRPEHFVPGGEVGAESNVWTSRVIMAEPMGAETYVYLETPGARDDLTIKALPDLQVLAGDQMRYTLPQDNCHVFNEEGVAFKRTVEIKIAPRHRHAA